jgi:SAM-dependent methyltransferase
MEPVEISDLIISYEPATLRRVPVEKAAVVSRFLREGNRRAARLVSRLPARGAFLDDDAVDALLVRVHCELQRLWEEFEQGARLLLLLRPLLEALRKQGQARPLRVVDIGCGLGFGVRWLAAKGALGDDVELIGADYNAALIREAGRLAERENLRCRFVVANAFQLEEPATVFLSTGVIHHFRGEGLTQFFREQGETGAQAFVHFDLKPTYLSLLGAWLFHKARVVEPLSQHDGVLSAMRAHRPEVLLAAARGGAPGYVSSMFDAEVGLLPIVEIFHAIASVAPELREAWMSALGKESQRFGEWR